MSILCRAWVAFLRLWIESDSICMLFSLYKRVCSSLFLCVHKDIKMLSLNPLPHNTVLFNNISSHTHTKMTKQYAKKHWNQYISSIAISSGLEQMLHPPKKSLLPWEEDTAWDAFLLYLSISGSKKRQHVAMATIASCLELGALWNNHKQLKRGH